MKSRATELQTLIASHQCHGDPLCGRTVLQAVLQGVGITRENAEYYLLVGEFEILDGPATVFGSSIPNLSSIAGVEAITAELELFAIVIGELLVPIEIPIYDFGSGLSGYIRDLFNAARDRVEEHVGVGHEHVVSALLGGPKTLAEWAKTLGPDAMAVALTLTNPGDYPVKVTRVAVGASVFPLTGGRNAVGWLWKYWDFGNGALTGKVAELEAENERLNGELNQCLADNAALEAELASVQGALDDLNAALDDPNNPMFRDTDAAADYLARNARYVKVGLDYNGDGVTDLLPHPGISDPVYMITGGVEMLGAQSIPRGLANQLWGNQPGDWLCMVDDDGATVRDVDGLPVPPMEFVRDLVDGEWVDRVDEHGDPVARTNCVEVIDLHDEIDEILGRALGLSAFHAGGGDYQGTPPHYLKAIGVATVLTEAQ